MLVVLVALAFGACGAGEPSSAEKFQGEKRLIADAIEELEEAGERKEPGRICTDIIAARLKTQIEQGGLNCTKEMEKAIEDADDFDLDVQTVTVTGTTATARVKGTDEGEDVVRTFQFAREAGRWRATSFGG